MDGENNQAPKKSNKGLIAAIIIIVVLIAIGVTIGVLYFTVFNKTEVDLSKFISIEFDGYEGSASCDEYDLIYDEDGLKEELDSRSKAEKLIDKIKDKVTLKNNEKLSNGDEVEVKIKVSDSWLKDKKIKLKSDIVKIKVSGLKEAASVDLFKDLKIEYEGVSPDLDVYIDTKSNNDFLKYAVTYKFRKEDSDETDETSYSLSGIKNGDKIVVRAEYDDEDLSYYGYSVDKDAEKTYTFTVKDQAEYVTDTKQLSDAVQESLKEIALKEIKSEADNNDYDVASTYSADYSDAGNYSYGFTHADPEYQTMYLATNKEHDDYSLSSEYNIVYVVYKVTYTDTTTSKTYDLYLTTEIDDVVVKDDKLEGKNDYYPSIFDNYDYEDENEAYRSSLDGINKALTDELEDDYTLAEVKK